MWLLLSPPTLITQPWTAAQVWQCCTKQLPMTNHMSTDCSVVQILSKSSFSGKTTSVAPTSSFWMTTGSMLMCSNTNHPMKSRLMNAWHSACPFFNSTLKIVALWQLCPIGINGMLAVEEVDMVEQLWFKRLLMISNTYYNHFNLGCTLCIDTGGVDKHWQQFSIGIFNTVFLKTAGPVCCCSWGWFPWFVDCLMHFHHSTLVCIVLLLYPLLGVRVLVS